MSEPQRSRYFFYHLYFSCGSCLFQKGLRIFSLDFRSFSLVLTFMDISLLKTHRLCMICSWLKSHQAKLGFSLRLWGLSKYFEGLIWLLIKESSVCFTFWSMKKKVFWAKLIYFGYIFWHQKISLFLPLKYLDFCLTFTVYIMCPFFVLFTVFRFDSVSFILNG